MGKLVFLLLVAFVCSTFGVDETLKFRQDVGDLEDDLSQDEVNDVSLGNDNEESMEDDLIDDEEPTDDVDGGDETIDKDALEQSTEDEMENVDALEKESEAQLEQPDASALASLESAIRKTGLAETQGTGKSVVLGKRHHHHHHHHHHKHHHHHHKVYMTCQSGTSVGGLLNTRKRVIYRTIKFSPSFKRTPAVVTGIQKLVEYRNHNEQFSIRVIKKTRTSMRIKISNAGKYNSLRYLYVNWMACPR